MYDFIESELGTKRHNNYQQSQQWQHNRPHHASVAQNYAAAAVASAWVRTRCMHCTELIQCKFDVISHSLDAPRDNECNSLCDRYSHIFESQNHITISQIGRRVAKFIFFFFSKNRPQMFLSLRTFDNDEKCDKRQHVWCCAMTESNRLRLSVVNFYDRIWINLNCISQVHHIQHFTCGTWPIRWWHGISNASEFTIFFCLSASDVFIWKYARW